MLSHLKNCSGGSWYIITGGSWRTRHQDSVAGLGGLRTEERCGSNLEGNHSNNAKADEKENYEDDDNKNYDGSVFSARGI